MIRITSKRDGFRRCGLSHSKAPADYPDGRFTPEELAILKAEPMLLVEEIPDPEPPGPREPSESPEPEPVAESQEKPRMKGKGR